MPEIKTLTWTSQNQRGEKSKICVTIFYHREHEGHCICGLRRKKYTSILTWQIRNRKKKNQKLDFYFFL